MITGDYIKSAIANKLAVAFPTFSDKIYKERIAQEFDKPCFFIWQVDSSQTKGIDNRYTRYYIMDVRYIPDMSEESKFEECQDIANTLYEELEYIEAESVPIKSTSMHAEITDDILHFIVHYKIRVQKSIEAEDKMAHITLEIEL